MEAPELIPAPALAFAIGFVAGNPAMIAKEPGRFSLLIDEARRRGLYGMIIDALPPLMRDAMLMAETMDRGASWSGRGHPRQTTFEDPRSGRAIRVSIRPYDETMTVVDAPRAEPTE
jgi:hypothetical protein